MTFLQTWNFSMIHRRDGVHTVSTDASRTVSTIYGDIMANFTSRKNNTILFLPTIIFLFLPSLF